MIIATDFDGVICEDKYPRLGNPNYQVIDYLKERRQNGDKVILWTSREGSELEDAVNYCKEEGLIFDALNINLPQSVRGDLRGDSRKIIADIYLDAHNMDVRKARSKTVYDKFIKKEMELLLYEYENGDPRNSIHTKFNENIVKTASEAAYTILDNDAVGYVEQRRIIEVIDRLLRRCPLTPINNNYEDWIYTSEIFARHKRCYDLCRVANIDTGEVLYYQNNCISFYDSDSEERLNISGPTRFLSMKIANDVWPITFPHDPYLRKNIKIYMKRDMLSPSPLKDNWGKDAFTLIEYSWIDIPKKGLKEISRYFVTEPGGYISFYEINEREYYILKRRPRKIYKIIKNKDTFKSTC